jgi:hypothetical protein
MDIRKRTTVLVFVSLLAGICPPAWTADSKSTAPDAAGTVSNPQSNSILSILKPVFTDTASVVHPGGKPCKTSQVYSQHDVVGDPETCIISRVTVGGGATATGIP